jgi:hypothetical protein
VTWVLTVAGDCAAEDERDLHERLRELLSEGRYGVTASQFGGAEVNGPAHGPPAVKKKAGKPVT